MQQKARRYPRLIDIGIVLLLAGVAPTVIGMVRGFHQIQHGEPNTAIVYWVGIAFHPLLVIGDNLGLLLILIGLVRAVRRRSGPVLADAKGEARIPTSIGVQAVQWVSVSRAGFAPVQVRVPEKWPLRVTLAPAAASQPATRP